MIEQGMRSESRDLMEPHDGIGDDGHEYELR